MLRWCSKCFWSCQWFADRLILKDESGATYVHYRAQNLNLAVQDAIKNNKEIRDMLNLIGELIAFIRGSPKR